LARRLLILGVAATLVAVPAAHADGDPASDYLITQRVFTPYQTKIPAADLEELEGLVRDAARQGYPIRVALISSDYDLGSVTVLWKQPKRYAKFLAQELAFVHKGPLLVVMPNGMGFYRVGSDPSAENALLATIPVKPGGSGLAQSASTAVKKLAAAKGLQLTPLKAPQSESSHRSRDRIVIVAAVAVLLAAGLGMRALLRRRQRA